jgi:hypothetical protein
LRGAGGPDATLCRSPQTGRYFLLILCVVCLRSRGQYFLSSIFGTPP